MHKLEKIINFTQNNKALLCSIIIGSLACLSLIAGSIIVTILTLTKLHKEKEKIRLTIAAKREQKQQLNQVEPLLQAEIKQAELKQAELKQAALLLEKQQEEEIIRNAQEGVRKAAQASEEAMKKAIAEKRAADEYAEAKEKTKLTNNDSSKKSFDLKKDNSEESSEYFADHYTSSHDSSLSYFQKLKHCDSTKDKLTDQPPASQTFHSKNTTIHSDLHSHKQDSAQAHNHSLNQP